MRVSSCCNVELFPKSKNLEVEVFGSSLGDKQCTNIFRKQTVDSASCATIDGDQRRTT